MTSVGGDGLAFGSSQMTNETTLPYEARSLNVEEPLSLF